MPNTLLTNVPPPRATAAQVASLSFQRYQAGLEEAQRRRDASLRQQQMALSASAHNAQIAESQRAHDEQQAIAKYNADIRKAELDWKKQKEKEAAERRAEVTKLVDKALAGKKFSTNPAALANDLTPIGGPSLASSTEGAAPPPSWDMYGDRPGESVDEPPPASPTGLPKLAKPPEFAPISPMLADTNIFAAPPPPAPNIPGLATADDVQSWPLAEEAPQGATGIMGSAGEPMPPPEVVPVPAPMPAEAPALTAAGPPPIALPPVVPMSAQSDRPLGPGGMIPPPAAQLAREAGPSLAELPPQRGQQGRVITGPMASALMASELPPSGRGSMLDESNPLYAQARAANAPQAAQAGPPTTRLQRITEAIRILDAGGGPQDAGQRTMYQGLQRERDAIIKTTDAAEKKAAKEREDQIVADTDQAIGSAANEGEVKLALEAAQKAVREGRLSQAALGTLHTRANEVRRTLVQEQRTQEREAAAAAKEEARAAKEAAKEREAALAASTEETFTTATHPYEVTLALQAAEKAVRAGRLTATSLRTLNVRANEARRRLAETDEKDERTQVQVRMDVRNRHATEVAEVVRGMGHTNREAARTFLFTPDARGNTLARKLGADLVGEVLGLFPAPTPEERVTASP